MAKLFFLRIPYVKYSWNYGYGETDYCLVQADTLDEAIVKAKNKFDNLSAGCGKTNDSFPDCEIKFDDNGVSQPIIDME